VPRRSTLALDAVKLVSGIAVGALFAAGAAWMLVRRSDSYSVLFEPAPTTTISEATKQTADCMYRLLQSTPSAREPNLMYVTSEGWTHPLVKYRTTYGDGQPYAVEFEAQKPWLNHHGMWFLTRFVGSIPPGFDIRSMDSIMETWKIHCNVDVDMAIN
jgi:hypothetical protein